MKSKYDDERQLFHAKRINEITDNIVHDRLLKQFEGEQDLKLVRKGQINDWKSYMTSEQCQQIKDRFTEICQRCDGLGNYWSKWNIF